nr:hypothetical protein [Tanacetum cinerariifolium]
MAQNINFSGSDQIQTPQYLDVNPLSPEQCNEVCQAKEDLFKSIQTFLETFICIPFEEKPQILFQAWEFFFAIQYSNPENPNELFQKLLEDLKQLVEYKESLENSSKEIAISSSNPEKEEPPQDSDIRKLIREECCVEASEEQKQNMEDTMLELVKIFATILSTKEPKYSSSMGYENSNTTPETESDKITKSGVEELVPILSEYEVTLEDKREYNDDILVYDDFEDIKYVEASLLDPEIVRDVRFLEELLIDDSILSYKSSDFEDNPSIPRPPPEQLDAETDAGEEIPVVMNDKDKFDEDYYFLMFDKESESQQEEIDVVSVTNDVVPPSVENDDSDREVDVVDDLRVDNSILNSKHEFFESEDSDFDNPSVLLPPSKPPDKEFKSNFVGRGGRGRGPRGGNDKRVDELNGQGNDQGLGANGGVEGVNGNVEGVSGGVGGAPDFSTIIAK